MQLAVSLAARGGAAVRPNPQVGCVLVRAGVVVGSGHHAYCGGPHAEAVALAEAGTDARGATAYVTLEPCDHQGRTPPCAQALIAAGVARVVVGVGDPNPLAKGGVDRLRDHGIPVVVGVCAADCEEVAEVFLTGVRADRAFLQLKLAATMDGFTAAADGTSQWISGELARAEVHRMRAAADAVLIGSGTALADDPRLDVRHVACDRQPLRVVLDRRLRLPISSNLADVTTSATLLLVEDPELIHTPHAAALRARGIEVACVTRDSSSSWLQAVLKTLRIRGYHHVFCEGGATLATALLRADLVDRIDLFQAPILLGTGRPLWSDFGVGTLSEARALRLRPPQLLGDDVWLTARRRQLEASSCSPG